MTCNQSSLSCFDICSEDSEPCESTWDAQWEADSDELTECYVECQDEWAACASDCSGVYDDCIEGAENVLNSCLETCDNAY